MQQVDRRIPALSVNLFATGLVVVALFGCSRSADQKKVATAAVERGRIERIVVATGTVEPER
jgi:multidrug efflux pump subunit AcrA (membrane-fusion protein)